MGTVTGTGLCHVQGDQVKTPFKVGDRVAVYGHGGTGKPLRITTNVEGFNSEGCIYLPEKDAYRQGYQGYDLTVVHPKQCRRLVKKRTLRDIAKDIAEMYRIYKSQHPSSQDELNAGCHLETLTLELTEYMERKKK